MAGCVSNLPIFGHFCHPIFVHKSTKASCFSSWTSIVSSEKLVRVVIVRNAYMRPYLPVLKTLPGAKILTKIAQVIRKMREL